MATALITGASSGIGLALARVFAADGIDVILSVRSEDKLHALAKEVREKYRVKARVIAADLSLPGEAQKIYDRVVEQVDYLVNNAGFGVYGGFAETERMSQHIVTRPCKGRSAWQFTGRSIKCWHLECASCPDGLWWQLQKH